MADQDQNKKQGGADSSDKEFPGYPHYPANEDITRPGNSTGRTDIDVEQMNASGKRVSQEQGAADTGTPVNADEAETKSDADVTAEDIAILDAATQNRDVDDIDYEEPMLDTTDEDGDPLNEPRPMFNATGADLDVPGSETDDGNEQVGEEDEENNYYSLGGDRMENLEEDPSE